MRKDITYPDHPLQSWLTERSIQRMIPSERSSSMQIRQVRVQVGLHIISTPLGLRPPLAFGKRRNPRQCMATPTEAQP